MTDANKDEARKCLNIARQALAADDLLKAQKFADKAQRLYASVEAQAFLDALDAARASRRTAGGPSTSASQHNHANSQNHSHAKPAGAAPHRAAGPAAPNLPPKPAKIEDPGTPEQKALVAQVIKAKDFYDVLGIAKEATDDDIKKAYRKLALKLHPDKNRALRADEAFKVVSRAFTCLSDADKRAYYDRTGYESTAAAQAAAAAQRGAGAGPGPGAAYYATVDDFDPEEIFNMFFGGAFGGPHTFRAQFGGIPRQRRHHGHGHGHGHNSGHHAAHGGGGGANAAADQQNQRAAILGLLQLAPIALILLFTFFSTSQSPPYSLVQESGYKVELLTARLSVPFYVKSVAELERAYPVGSSARHRLERQVEGAYYERLEARCQQERLMRHRAWSWGNREQARAMKLEACEEIDRVNEKLRGKR